MAISRMQEPRQLYGLGSIVKKAVRGVKKIVKSPLGKAAIIGGLGMIPFGASKASLFSRGIGALRNLGGGSIPGSSFLSKLNPFTNPNLSFGQKAFIGGGLGLTALPFLMNKFGDDEEVEEEVDVMDVAGIRNRARDYYRGATDTGLNFMPGKQYVQPNFYAAAGGRAMLNMGGQPGGQQAEQMLMAEFVKYKNKGGTLSFEQFVKAVMQAQQEQDMMAQGAGMEQPQPVAMAADGGRIGYAGGQLVSPSADGSRPGYRGLENIFVTPDPSDKRRPPNKFDFLRSTGPMTDEQKEFLQNMTEEDWKEADKGGFVDIIIDILKTPYIIRGGETNEPIFADGGRIGKQEGGIMETEEASEMIDMGGMEKDYRETGGFVEMGGKERADDVPARLSKNEFVFTADAVRNAGGGDIDKGAEVMENLMNNLEQGGEVSEDSQGLEGAQAMYDQQQMLQSRIA